MECVIADEPTANLDPALTAEAMRLFRQIAARVPVVIITHDPAVADACDRTIVLQSAVTAPSGAPEATPRKRSRRTVLALAGGVVLAAAGIAALAVTGVFAPHPHTPSARPTAHASKQPALAKAPAAPSPRLAQFVPASQQVLRVERFNLTGRGVPIVAVTTTSQPTADNPIPPKDVLLLAWDNYTRRWSVIYDAAKTPVNLTSEPDAFTSSYELNYVPSPQPLFPRDMGVTAIQLTEIHDQPGSGADLMLSAGIIFGDGGGQAIAIIHYNGVTASIAWAFMGSGGREVITGTAPHQQVAITSEWYTPSDPHCCPDRPYRFVIAPATGQTGEYYQAVSDNRPWIGAYITFQTQQYGNSQAIVTHVIPGSPAAGILQAGDILHAVAGSQSAGHGLGPAVLDELGKYKAGDIVRLLVQRGGALTYVTVRLGSLARPQAVNAGNNLPVSGNTPEYMI